MNLTTKNEIYIPLMDIIIKAFLKDNNSDRALLINQIEETTIATLPFSFILL